MFPLRYSTAATVIVGPFLSAVDGITAVPDIAPSNSSAAVGFVQSKNGTANSSYTITSWTSIGAGLYQMGISTTDSNTQGRLRLDFAAGFSGSNGSATATIVPVFHEYTIWNQNSYDAHFASGGVVLNANATQFGGQAVVLDGNNLPNVNAKDWGGVAVTGMPLPTSSYTAPTTPPTTTQIAAAILATPANLLSTDATGKVALTSAEHTAISGTDVPAALHAQGYTTARAPKLDNLDVATSTRLATSGYTPPATAGAIATAVLTDATDTLGADILAIKAKTDALPASPAASTDIQNGLTAAGLTAARAARLDNLDAAVSSRLAASAYVVAPSVASIAGAILANPAGPIATDASGRVTLAGYAPGQDPGSYLTSQGYTTTRAGAIDNLDAAVSSRMATSSYSAAPSSASIASAVWTAANRSLTAFGLQVTVGGYAPGQDPGTFLVTQGFNASRVTALDNLDAPVSSRLAMNAYAPAPPVSSIASAILATPANKLTTDASGSVNINLAQSVPATNTAQSVGDALNAARAQGFGPWTLDPNARTLTLFAADGVTVVRTFTLDSVTSPTMRT